MKAGDIDELQRTVSTQGSSQIKIGDKEYQITGEMVAKVCSSADIMLYVFLNSSFLKVLNDRNKNRKDKKMDVIITRQEVLQFLAAINMTGANIDREV